MRTGTRHGRQRQRPNVRERARLDRPEFQNTRVYFVDVPLLRSAEHFVIRRYGLLMT